MTPILIAPTSPAAISLTPQPAKAMPKGDAAQTNVAEDNQPFKSLLHSSELALQEETAAAKNAGTKSPKGSKNTSAESPKDSKKEAQPNHIAAVTPSGVQAEMHVDTRSLRLALPSKEKAHSESVATAVQERESPKIAALNSNAPAVQSVAKQPVAFSVNLSKASSDSHSTGQPAVTPIKENGEQKSGDQGKQHSGSGHTADKAGNTSDSSSKTSGASPVVEAATTPTMPSTPASMTTVPTNQQVANTYATTANVKAAEHTPIAHVTDVAETPQTPTVKPTSIDFRVSGQGDSEVNVRVSQRAGDVQVTVRTGDNDLASSLRQHLPELSNKITQTGMHADFWQPSSAQSASADSGSDSHQGGNAQDQREQSGNPNNHSRNEQQQSQRHSAWRDELTHAENKE